MSTKATRDPQELFIYVCVSINVCESSSLSLTLQQNLMSQDKFSSKGGWMVVEYNWMSL